MKSPTTNLFKYRVVAGYTGLIRFIDRPFINRDMFLMTNDVILLSGKVQEDGSLFPEYSDNSCTPNSGVSYVAEWEGRTGVMSFNGNGAQMVAADNRCLSIPKTRVFGAGSQRMTVSGWMYIDKWEENAEIFPIILTKTTALS